jgi:hypothetical protein
VEGEKSEPDAHGGGETRRAKIFRQTELGMRPRTTAEEDVIRKLHHLIALEYDEAASTEAATARLADGSRGADLRRVVDVHRRHTAQLSLLVHTLGGGAIAHGDLPEMVTTARAVVAGVAGDRAILEALKHGEEGIARAYALTLSMELPSRVHAVLAQHLRDAESFASLVADALGALPVRAA